MNEVGLACKNIITAVEDVWLIFYMLTGTLQEQKETCESEVSPRFGKLLTLARFGHRVRIRSRGDRAFSSFEATDLDSFSSSCHAE